MWWIAIPVMWIVWWAVADLQREVDRLKADVAELRVAAEKLKRQQQ